MNQYILIKEYNKIENNFKWGLQRLIIMQEILLLCCNWRNQNEIIYMTLSWVYVFSTCTTVKHWLALTSGIMGGSLFKIYFLLWDFFFLFSMGNKKPLFSRKINKFCFLKRFMTLAFCKYLKIYAFSVHGHENLLRV